MKVKNLEDPQSNQKSRRAEEAKMGIPTADDELLVILLTNLRNAAATFGEGSPPHETIKTIIEEHLQAMKRRGAKTNIASMSKPQPSMSFENLAFRPKPKS
ncbi:Hypothetical protein R9X50_00747300 [Acrodontium crateriforme]|uniref:Uncharacterized protein n=1 Tax=Acrodontium crateriforme TaxID=150365 RepID=A0AAQ3R7Q1_9PEZI|nr:Hypothetical protein R9X50_00747300 [Acrodontium crateriforme]